MSNLHGTLYFWGEDFLFGSLQLSGGKSSLKHRRVKHYGYEFMYTVNNVDINHPLEVDIPPECSNIIDRILENQLIAEKPDQLTINQYQPGQGNAVHPLLSNLLLREYSVYCLHFNPSP